MILYYILLVGWASVPKVTGYPLGQGDATSADQWTLRCKTTGRGSSSSLIRVLCPTLRRVNVRCMWYHRRGLFHCGGAAADLPSLGYRWPSGRANRKPLDIG